MLPKRKSAKQNVQHPLIGRKFWHKNIKNVIYNICKHETNSKLFTVKWFDTTSSIHASVDYNIMLVEQYIDENTWVLLTRI